MKKYFNLKESDSEHNSFAVITGNDDVEKFEAAAQTSLLEHFDERVNFSKGSIASAARDCLNSREPVKFGVTVNRNDEDETWEYDIEIEQTWVY